MVIAAWLAVLVIWDVKVQNIELFWGLVTMVIVSVIAILTLRETDNA